MKKDAIPGFINEMWFEVDEDRTGLYRGQCTELCGRDHAFMPIVVDVRSRADFDSWLAGQAAKKTPAAPAAPASEAPTEAPSAAPAVTDPAEQSETATAGNASAAQPTA